MWCKHRLLTEGHTFPIHHSQEGPLCVQVAVWEVQGPHHPALLARFLPHL